jgi:hypothetical protein
MNLERTARHATSWLAAASGWGQQPLYSQQADPLALSPPLQFQARHARLQDVLGATYAEGQSVAAIEELASALG